MYKIQTMFMLYFILTKSIFQKHINTHKSIIVSVVEFAPDNVFQNISSKVSSKEYIHNNLFKIGGLIREAALCGSDMVVFPEYGITGFLDDSDYNAERFFDTYMPQVGSQPRSSLRSNSFILAKLSEFAKENSIYLVVNLVTQKLTDHCRNDSVKSTIFKYYNTNIAFDRNGTVVARYRKYNLYGENHVSSTKPFPDISYFKTDFGMTFGLIICFDINYAFPSWQLIDNIKVDAIAFSSAWYNELPFLTAVGYHSGWSIAHNITLLSSAFHSPFGFGSGIYGGSSGGILAYVQQPNISYKARIISASIRPMSVSYDTFRSIQSMKGSSFIYEDLSQYKKIKIPLQHMVHEASMHTIESKTSCSFSCRLLYSVSQNNISTQHDDEPSYYLISFSGRRTVGGGKYSIGVQVCGVVVLCDEIRNMSCNISSSLVKTDFLTLRLEATFSVGVKPMPIAHDDQLQPLEFISYGRNLSSCSYYFAMKSKLEEHHHLYSFGLYGRNYLLDD